MTELTTKAEQFAAAAGELEAFSGFNLSHVKNQVAELMRHIGENGIFDQYTRHDIAHIDAMLTMLDWLIPSSTQDHMTSADWLLIVLAIYFHDLGMLVTKAEYNSRNETSFPFYRDTRLATNDDEGKDYIERLSELTEESRERFLYQEFVRSNHAARIRNWIDVPARQSLGAVGDLPSEIRNLLANLDPVFRADLAKVCESHHSSDLDDTAKYSIRRPYGNTPAERANVQYAAIILRTADLLQITRDRTPSIAFRVLTPSDPLSQREWAKHMAVRAILPQPARNRDGKVDESQQSSVIEVHARFTEEIGFFGLTAYLSYASQQLNQSYEWAEASRKDGSKHLFPWRDIDTSHIETEGFLPSHYEFKLDQRKILDLLIGHTLYNDTNVVIRELAQNAIDAVRLAYSPGKSKEESSTRGHVVISWNPDTRILEFRDNGTGMTQEIIENNFLRVGASRYQDPRFRERHPNFNPISRFGIGVLSAFMIADSVEVFTCTKEEPEVRQISLRSVHGRYLIRLLDKESDEVAKTLTPHGTLVRLRVRASAKIGNVTRIARDWFVLPQCNLEVKTADMQPVRIGHADLAEALREELVSSRLLDPDSLSSGSVEIKTASRGAVSLAYAVSWSKWFRTWELLSLNTARYNGNSRQRRLALQEQVKPKLGICIEGVRVEFDSPGYEGLHLLAMANASGPKAPRTNVARSGLEDTPELRDLVQDVYRVYCAHISREIDELHENRGRSVTRASSEAAYLLNSLQAPRESSVSGRTRLRSASTLRDEMRRVEVLLVEQEGVRSKSSLQNLATLGTLYTIDDPFIDTAESFLLHLPSDASLQQVLNSFSEEPSVLPNGPLLVSKPTGVLSDMFFSSWQVSKVDFNEQALRTTTKWTPRTDHPFWVNDITCEQVIASRDIYQVLAQFDFTYSDTYFHIPTQEVPFNGFDKFDYDGILIGKQTYLLPAKGYIADIGGPSRLQDFTDTGMAVFFHCLWTINVNYRGRDSRGSYYYRESPDTLNFKDLISTRLATALQHVSWIDSKDTELILNLLPLRPLKIFDAHTVTQRGKP